MFILADKLKDKIDFAEATSDTVFIDIRKEPFDIYGLYDPKTAFVRTPRDVAEATNETVAQIYRQTAGGRIRFTTDSPFIELRYKVPILNNMFHMPISGSSCFDLYIHEKGVDKFAALLATPGVDVYANSLSNGIRKELGEGIHSVTIHFPLYNDVSEVYVGLKTDSHVDHGAKYRDVPPIVYYGSSITQGGCCSRPGNSYESIISANLNIDHINLGFSGSGRAEESICNYVASLNMSVFVMDYDYNAPTPEYLEKTHYPFYRIVRDKHPELPIIFVTRPVFRLEDPENRIRRDIIYKTYTRAIEEKDKNVYFIDGEFMFPDRYRDACSVDTVHPNDLGFHFMAEAIGMMIERILGR